MSTDDTPPDLPSVRGGQDIASTADYAALRDGIVERVSAARERASRAVNTELVLLYRSIGRAILAEQERHSWGGDVVGLLARDLRADGRLGRGFSRRNLFYMRRFAALWPEQPIVQPLAAQIGWTHHQVLLDAFADEPGLYAWYAAKAVDHRWSRRERVIRSDRERRRRVLGLDELRVRRVRRWRASLPRRHAGQRRPGCARRRAGRAAAAVPGPWSCT